jgi:hypothetical protein
MPPLPLLAQVMLACAGATVGIALMSFDSALPSVLQIFGDGGAAAMGDAAAAAVAGAAAVGAAAVPSSLKGDLLVGASALFYSMHVIRLGEHKL